jgi:hypothetical protein
MPTRSAVIARFTSEFYPDCGATEAGIFFDDALRDVLVATELANSEVTATLTAGTPTVALSENVIRIHQAFYEQSSATPYQYAMTETSLDALAAQRKQFRTNSGQPKAYFLTSGVAGQVATLQVGLTPTPDITSSGGYPRIRFITTMYIQLASGESLPTGLGSVDVILFNMAMRYAIRRNDTRAAYYENFYRRALRETQLFVKNRLKSLPDQDFLVRRRSNGVI